MTSVVQEPSTKADVVWPVLMVPTLFFLPSFFFFKQIFILSTFRIHLMCFVTLGWAVCDSTHCNVCSKNSWRGGVVVLKRGVEEGMWHRNKVTHPDAKVGQSQGAGHSESCR